MILYFLCVFLEFWSFNELCRFMKRPFWDPCTNYSKFLLLVLYVRHLVDEDFPVSSKHLDSARCRTVRLPSVDVDCCMPCSNAFACQREHSMPDALPLQLWQRLPVTTHWIIRWSCSSQRWRADASDDWDEEWNFHVRRWCGLPLRTDWLSDSAGSQLSQAACKKSWRALEYKAPLSSTGANFLQLSP